MAFILTIGCVFVAVRGISMVLSAIPRIWQELKLAQSLGGEPTAQIWLSLAASCAALLIAGTALALAVFTCLLIDGTMVLVDEFGISVLCLHLPAPMARRLGAGRVLWKNVAKLERHGLYFVLHGSEAENKSSKEIVKFMLVDQLDKLIFIVMERSPNLKLNS
jgi:hypothetical protein